MRIRQVNSENKYVKWWGKFRFTWGYANFYVSIASLIMLIITTYNTGAKEHMSFVVFLLIIVVFVALGMTIEHIISIPAQLSVGNEQAFKHNSLYRKQIEELDAKNDKQFKQLEGKIDALIVAIAKEKAEASNDKKDS